MVDSVMGSITDGMFPNTEYSLASLTILSAVPQRSTKKRHRDSQSANSQCLFVHSSVNLCAIGFMYPMGIHEVSGYKELKYLTKKKDKKLFRMLM